MVLRNLKNKKLNLDSDKFFAAITFCIFTLY